jgi:hypothetical protein
MSLQDFQRAMTAFQANGWVIPEDTGPLNKHWAVNPALAGLFENELKEHQRLHEEIVEKARRQAGSTVRP